MSGSSLDGLDIVYVHIDETRGKWAFEVKAAACHPYNGEWIKHLKDAKRQSVPDFLKLHTAYGHYLAGEVKQFMHDHDLDLKVDFVVSHGHTVFHEPHNKTTFQLGDGASLSASLAMPVISDLRSIDVALGGQGAPIVPVGDRLFFGDHKYLLNLGGIANLSANVDGEYKAFDITACNQLLNYFAAKQGLDYDDEGNLAAAGVVNEKLLEQINQLAYFGKEGPKSLANEFSEQEILPLMEAANIPIKDALATCVYHIAEQIVKSTENIAQNIGPATIFTTGGGAFNTYLISVLQSMLQPLEISLVIPDKNLVQYKEAVVMALIGTLRWREEENVFASVTGATRDSVGGALWVGR